MSLQIGAVKLPHNAVLAPMSGVTDKPFRQIVRACGGGLVVSEMVASHAVLSAVKDEMRKLQFSAEEESPLSIQLAGWDPDIMAEAARIAEQLGAGLIDINMGCPAKKVTGRLSGSALMRDLPLAADICRAVKSAVSVPVTLKMRLGWDPTSRNAPELARIAEAEGIEMLAVHGRTRCQMYKGEADWSAVHEVKDVVGLPLLVNGDIKTLDDVADAKQKSGADGVMIGRGAQGRPWFVAQAGAALNGNIVPRTPTIAERHEILRNHLDSMLSFYGTHALRLARKHMAWYAAGLPGSAALRQVANNATDAASVFAAIESYFLEQSEQAA